MATMPASILYCVTGHSRRQLHAATANTGRATLIVKTMKVLDEQLQTCVKMIIAWQHSSPKQKFNQKITSDENCCAKEI